MNNLIKSTLKQPNTILYQVISRSYSTTHHKHPTGHHHHTHHTHDSTSSKKDQTSSGKNASPKKSIVDTPVSIFEQPEVDINERSTDPLPWDREREGKLLQKKLSDIDEIKWREAEDRQVGSVIYRRAEEVCIENHDLHALPHLEQNQAVNDDKPLEK